MGLEEPSPALRLLRRGEEGEESWCPQTTPVIGILGSLCPCQPSSNKAPPGLQGEEEPCHVNCIFSSLCLSLAAIRHLSPPPAPRLGWRLQEDSWGEGETWSVLWLPGGWEEWGLGQARGSHCPIESTLSLAWRWTRRAHCQEGASGAGREGGTAQAGLQRGGS